MLGAHINVAERVIVRGARYTQSEEIRIGFPDGCYFVRHHPFGGCGGEPGYIAAMSSSFRGCLAQVRELLVDGLWRSARTDQEVKLPQVCKNELARWTEGEVKLGIAPRIDLRKGINEDFMFVENPYWEMHWVPQEAVVELLLDYLTEHERERKKAEERRQVWSGPPGYRLGWG